MKIREGVHAADVEAARADQARRRALAVRSSAEGVKAQRQDADVARLSAEARAEATHRMSVDLAKVDRVREAMHARDLAPDSRKIAAGLAEDGG